MANAVDSFQSPPAARCPHLLPALLAAGTIILGLVAVRFYVAREVPRHMALFATFSSPAKLTGNVLQTAAFTLPDSLPIYGSSELDRQADNRPDAFFRAKPTGFTVFPIGRGGTTCLMILQKIAAAGPVLRGKKTAVFLSPTWFDKGGVTRNAVDANVTAPLLGAWVFNDDLSADLKRRIASRLLDYPSCVEHQPLIAAALTCLAEPTFGNRVLFDALAPLGKLQNVLLVHLEYCTILWEMFIEPDRLPAHSLRERERDEQAGEPDWTRLAEEAEARDRKSDDGATYSASLRNVSEKLREHPPRYQVPGSRDNGFVTKMSASEEWTDLGLLIDAMKELGADALFISQPFNGVYRDLGGTTPEGRRFYYDHLAASVAPSGYGLRDFSEHEEDRFFFNDTGHPSAKAWIYYDRALNEFYHRTRK